LKGSRKNDGERDRTQYRQRNKFEDNLVVTHRASIQKGPAQAESLKDL